MKNAMLIGTGALLLLFGISAPAFAQEQHDPQEQPAKPPEGKPTDKPQAEQPKTPDDRARPDNAAKPPKETERKPEAQRPEDAQRNNQRAGNGRIPDDKFKSHFGREHTFHVGHPTVV
jgi:outer membrane biosynthesis protein TonB